MHGYALQNAKAQVQRVREATRTKVKRLTLDKKILAQNVKHATSKSLEVKRTSEAKHKEVVAALKLKVKIVKKDSKEAAEKAAKETEQCHKVEVSRLERGKEGLRESYTKLRGVFKETLRHNEEKHDAIVQQYSAVMCQKQKLERSLNTERIKANGMIESVCELETKLKDLGEVRLALELAERELATANRAIASLTRAVAQEKKKANVAKALATKKHKDNVLALEGELTKSEANVLALTAQVTGLSKDLDAARSVRLL